jgi:cyanate permease
MTDYPETAPFLSEDERAYVVARLQYQISPEDDAPLIESSDEFSWHAVRAAFTDWQVWLGIVLFWSCVAPLYGISLFLPTIIKDLGYKKATAQLLTVPVYSFAAITGVIIAWRADKAGKRTPFIGGSQVAILVGFIMCISSSKPVIVYVGIFIAAAGVYGAHPGNISLISNNLSPNAKRAAGTGLHFAGGNLAGGTFFLTFYITLLEQSVYLLDNSNGIKLLPR